MNENTNESEAFTDPETEDRRSTEVPGRALLAPAIGILVVSILSIFGGLFFAVFTYSSISPAEFSVATFLKERPHLHYAAILVMYSLVLAIGALSMVRLRSYGWAMTVCLLCCVPILSPCYVLGIPFGIWGIIILRRPEVRESFGKTDFAQDATL